MYLENSFVIEKNEKPHPSKLRGIHKYYAFVPECDKAYYTGEVLDQLQSQCKIIVYYTDIKINPDHTLV
jgi:hypothetical protein